MNRRDLLKASAALAALVSLPATDPVAARVVSDPADVEPGELLHTGLCFHRIYRPKLDTRARLDEAYDALRATFSPEQRELFSEYDEALVDEFCDEHELYVYELARHAPALAPMIYALAFDHVNERYHERNGVCCSPEDVKTWHLA